jgi:hypothetical protein
MLSAAEKHQAILGNGKKPAKAAAVRASTAAGSPQQAATPAALPASIFQSPDEAPDRIQVSYQQRDSRFELAAGRHSLLAGTWHWELRVGDQPLDSSTEIDSACWENNCWENNIDVSYAELQLDLPSGLQIERQILLARRDRFALLADVVKIPGNVDSFYRSRFPLSDQIRCVLATDTREIILYNGRRAVARALPISLPEWRRQPGGEFQALDGLTLTQPIAGRHGHVALFIDLDPQRIKRQLTWRQLTVGESLQVVPREVAAGYRIQIGREQWLVYRSLAPSGNRTVLGQNFSTEFVVARFRPNGIAEKILEIL